MVDAAGAIVVRPVTAERLPDLERFSCGHGKFAWCSCQRWRMPSTVFKASSKDERVAALAAAAAAGVPVGVLAYAGPEPVGWCSVAPRSGLAALERYRALARIDDAEVWSVVCFVVDRAHRGHGVASVLLAGAVRYAEEQGARIVEGYPVPRGALYGYMGWPELFRAAGFVDVTPAGRTRLVMRWEHTGGAVG